MSIGKLILNFPTKFNCSSFSNLGDLITVAAPGGDIRSTIPDNKYGNMSGTSMAAPHVSGLATLILSNHANFSATQIKQCILSAAQANGKSITGHNFKVISAPEAIECRGTVELPDKVDIVFSIDLTGSMGGEINRVKTEIETIINNLRTIASPSTDFKFGVVSYEDYAGVFDSRSCGSTYQATYGAIGTKPGGDAAFRIDQALTADSALVASTTRGLVIGWGADGPQSYGRVFWELGQEDTGTSIGFRNDALKLVVNFGANVPHDTNLNEGIESPPFSTFDTGIDPGRNNTVDCGDDDIDFQNEALAAMVSKGIHILPIDSSGFTPYIQYWQYWASVTGGTVAAINAEGSIPGGLNLSELIISLLKLIP